MVKSLYLECSFRFLVLQTFVLKACDFECDSEKATCTHCRFEKQFHGRCNVKVEKRPYQVTRGLCVNLITYYTRQVTPFINLIAIVTSLLSCDFPICT